MDEIQYDFLLPALPDRVWRALTDPAKLATWLGEGDFAAVPGRPFVLRPRELPGPVTGVVREVVAPSRLVLDWEVGGARTTMTWLVSPARGGSALRVIRAGGPGGAGDAEAAYRLVFGERLRSVVSRGMVAGLALDEPVVRVDRPLLLPGPVVPPSDPEQPRRRSMSLWAAALAVFILVVVASTAWRLLPGTSEPGEQISVGDAPNASATGASAGAGSTAPVPTGRPRPSATGQSRSVDPSAPAGTAGPTSAAPSLPPSSPVPGHLEASYTITKRGLLSYTAKVTVSNAGGTDERWHSVAVRLSGVNLAVTVQGTAVKHEYVAPEHCFRPTAAVAVVAPGVTFAFSFVVTTVAGGVLGSVQGLSLDASACG